ncbi:MAG: DinB family protein [Caldilineaceae bacterium]|nr:DinB family protein [Caldilineaceae bacterium]
MDSQTAVSLLRAQYGMAHSWVEGTMQDVTAEIAHKHPPGRLHPIAAEYIHIAVGEDYYLQALARGATPLVASSFAGKTGASEVPPLGDWGDWGRTVQVDLDAARAYAQAVYAATDDYLASLNDADLEREVDLSAVGLGTQTVGFVLNLLLLNTAAHAGEISALKGIQGLRGYPF